MTNGVLRGVFFRMPNICPECPSCTAFSRSNKSDPQMPLFLKFLMYILNCSIPNLICQEQVKTTKRKQKNIGDDADDVFMFELVNLLSVTRILIMKKWNALCSLCNYSCKVGNTSDNWLPNMNGTNWRNSHHNQRIRATCRRDPRSMHAHFLARRFFLILMKKPIS